ncbi:MAG TPA: DUF4292 domain-containing protein [Geopsychrobacteraceae bacterium]|nr:DUF4292 domain-containing protein [Geopsychrobacteraceae bacterium]
MFLLIIGSGCARPDRTPIPLPSEERLVHQLAQGSDLYRSLDAEAKIGVHADGKYVSTQQFLLLEKPDRLRTDVLTTFGQLALQLAVDQDELSVFLNTTVPGRFYQGAATDENLLHFTRLPLNFKDLIRLLLYDLPLIPGEKMQASLHERGAQLKITAEKNRQEIVFDRQLRPVESRYYRNGSLWLQVNYESFSDDDGFPQKVQLEMPEQKTRASVRFSQTRTNTDIPADRFVIKQPANAELLRLPH